MPTTVTGLLLFITLLLPGVTFVALRERSTPSRNRSIFRETSAVVAVSVACDVVSLAVFLTVSSLRPSWTPDIRRLGRDGKAYFVENYPLISVWALGTLVFAILLGLAAALVAKRFGPHESTMSAWWMLFFKWKKGSDLYVSCALDDDSWIEGYVSSFNQASDENGDRELILFSPIKYTVDKKYDAQDYPVEAVAIASRRIVSMFVSYLPSGSHSLVATSREGVSASLEELTTGDVAAP